MDELKQIHYPETSEAEANENENTLVVERQITLNDMRSRIFPIPRLIKDNMPEGLSKMDVYLEDGSKITLSVDKAGRYLAGITKLYKKEGLILEDGSFNPKKSIWTLSSGVLKISFS
ncbi:MAG: hypothetical protein LBE20_01490 [Deltaproteobacteria bacterium]|jgi:hypothetical protein|nr:hypothetical protein [Deltaproteobacteria bacterium]